MSIHSSTNANLNLRNIGEGVLGDSDTTSGSDRDEEGETSGVKSSDPEISHRPLPSPHLSLLRMTPAPSPLSRVAGHHVWTEDELDRESNDDDDNASSPSPQSTETDSDVTSSANKPRVSRRSSERNKSRSRSSTVASLVLPRPLIHQDSRISVRTVTAGESPFNVQEGSNGIQSENSSPHQRGHGRQRSLAVSEFMLSGAKSAFVAEDERNDSSDDGRLSERRIESIVVEDMRFRETTLCALREALEVFVEKV
jgi:WD repeat-containing protein 24